MSDLRRNCQMGRSRFHGHTPKHVVYTASAERIGIDYYYTYHRSDHHSSIRRDHRYSLSLCHIAK